jgi:hypothetical protein
VQCQVQHKQAVKLQVSKLLKLLQVARAVRNLHKQPKVERVLDNLHNHQA